MTNSGSGLPLFFFRRPFAFFLFLLRLPLVSGHSLHSFVIRHLIRVLLLERCFETRH